MDNKKYIVVKGLNGYYGGYTKEAVKGPYRSRALALAVEQERLMRKYAKFCGYNYPPLGWKYSDYTVAGWQKLLNPPAKKGTIYFDGKAGKVIERDSHVTDFGSHKETIKMVHIEFEDGKRSWEVADDKRMGLTAAVKEERKNLVLSLARTLPMHQRPAFRVKINNLIQSL